MHYITCYYYSNIITKHFTFIVQYLQLCQQINKR